MLGMLIRWLLSALALVLTSKIVPGITVDSFTALLIAAIVLGLVNAVVRPILVFFTLPLTFLTLGLFLLVVNAITFGLAAWLVPASRSTASPRHARVDRDGDPLVSFQHVHPRRRGEEEGLRFLTWNTLYASASAPGGWRRASR
jgi:putative membrane protein